MINQFKKQIDKSSFPTKNVLENVLANLYWQYFNQNRWKFYQRTKTAKKVDKNDFRTWNLNTLFKEIHSYFNASLEEKLLLQKVDVHQFASILNIVKEFRPTLFDFLAHNALDFYKTLETNIAKPAYQFTIDYSTFLSDAKTFSRLNLETKDSLSLQFNALKIYQDLIGFHLVDKNLKALADVDLQRLQFVYKHATFTKKQFLETLKTIKLADYILMKLQTFIINKQILTMQQLTKNIVLKTKKLWQFVIIVSNNFQKVMAQKNAPI